MIVILEYDLCIFHKINDHKIKNYNFYKISRNLNKFKSHYVCAHKSILL